MSVTVSPSLTTVAANEVSGPHRRTPSVPNCVLLVTHAGAPYGSGIVRVRVLACPLRQRVVDAVDAPRVRAYVEHELEEIERGRAELPRRRCRE